MSEDQSIHDLCTAHGQFAAAALDKLKARNLNAWNTIMHALTAGGMLTVNTTAALSGLLQASLYLTLSTGQTVNLMRVDLGNNTPPTLN